MSLSPQPLESDLRLLFAINQILVGSLEPLSVLEPVLAALVEGTHLQHAVVAMIHRTSGELRIEAAVGLTVDEQRAAEKRVDASPIAEAVALSQPMTLPLEEGDHPLLGVCSQPEPCSLLVIPIQLSGEIVGAIAGDFPSTPHSELNHVSMLMSTVASMIAQAVRLRQRAAEERDSLRAENERLRDALKERYRPENIVGDSKPMLTVFDQIARVCRADATVLIRGESGVGKELVAAAIHYSSGRATKPFVKVNCAALPATLLESELFGHEKGAFTGAIQERLGRFELADGGTLFLDEIGEFPLTTQVLLLRFLQERQFERIGSAKTRSTDVRVIAATNADVEAQVASGAFREDLY
ncbi:MAG: sigma 54-interacting transcriptional regulator, partial [Planctomycetota bacterium]|nr:sigma 54-interacting transcriptional regulator [Planctomycetota bacterium]